MEQQNRRIIKEKENWNVDKNNLTEDGYLIEPDWEEMKKNIRPWKMFYNIRESLDIKGFINELIGKDDLYENNIDYIANEAYDGVNVILSDNGYYDRQQLEKYFDEQIQDLELTVENNMIYNIYDMIQGSIFLYDHKYEIAYMGEDNDDYNKFVAEAIQYGFSEEQANEVWINSSDGGVGGVGILVDPEDLWNVKDNKPITIDGNVILYGYNNIEGSGYYILGNGIKTLKFKYINDLVDNIDYGSYSLGDVFGTNDWIW